MTVIVAIVTPEGAWMGADSLSSTDSAATVTATPEVERIGRFLVGTAGPWNASDAFKRHFRANQHASIEEIASGAPHYDEAGALVLEGRKIYIFSGAGYRVATTKRRTSYATAGIGGLIASGSLFASMACGTLDRSSVNQ